MASDRATLANVLANLEEADNLLKTWFPLDGGMEGVRRGGMSRYVFQAQMMIWYCEGRLRDLLADPIPPVRDAVDEASAELGETWD